MQILYHLSQQGSPSLWPKLGLKTDFNFNRKSNNIDPSRLIGSLLFSCSVMSNSFGPHGLQHARHPCPSPSPGICSNSRPLSRWYHPTNSSYVAPFTSCPQFFPATGSLPMSRPFALGGQSIGALASASVLPMAHITVKNWLILL